MSGETYLGPAENAELRAAGLLSESEVAIAISDRLVAEDIITHTRRLLDAKRTTSGRVLLKG